MTYLSLLMLAIVIVVGSMWMGLSQVVSDLPIVVNLVTAEVIIIGLNVTRFVTQVVTVEVIIDAAEATIVAAVEVVINATEAIIVAAIEVTIAVIVVIIVAVATMVTTLPSIDHKFTCLSPMCAFLYLPFL